MPSFFDPHQEGHFAKYHSNVYLKYSYLEFGKSVVFLAKDVVNETNYHVLRIGGV